MNQRLINMGWCDFFSNQLTVIEKEILSVARVVVEHRGQYELMSEKGECIGILSGKLRMKSEESGDKIATGDWILFKNGEGDSPHVIERRLERYLIAIRGCIIEPRIVLTKLDLCVDAINYTEQISERWNSPTA